MTSGYYRHPSVSGDRIVFASEDDLWEVPIEGGRARRLTANPGPSAFPAYSPDGQTIAYAGRDEGVSEVHVMDASGGAPSRLTFHGALTQVVGWDGDSVIYGSNAEWPFSNDFRLWSVPSGGGPPALLPWGPARAWAPQPGGPGLVLGRQTADPARWKRYRGGRAGALWIDRNGDGEFSPLVGLAGNLASPMWVGKRIYFISDHEGHGNIYSVTPTGRSLRRHTHHEDFYARNASSDGRVIVYHAGADLWRLDPASAEPERVDVSLPSARPHRNRRFISPGKYVESVDLHPEGHSLALTVRGGSFTMGLWEGAVRRHGPVSSVRRRLTSWLSDGKRIVSVTDETGEDRLVVEDPGTGDRRLIDKDVGRVRSMDVSPAGDHRVAITNHRLQMLLVSLDSGRVSEVYRSSHYWISGTAWSADGRWLAFAAATTPRTQSLFIADTSTRGKPVQITSESFDDRWPSFDPAGRYLYFVSSRVFDPVPDTHFHDYSFPNGTLPHLITLRKDVSSPFDPAQRQVRAPGSPPDDTPRGSGSADEADGKGAKQKTDQPEPVEIDLDGIERRVVAFPQSPGRYGPVVGARGRVFTVSFPISTPGDSQEKPSGRMEAWDFNTEKIEQIADGVSGVSANPAGTVLAVGVGKRVRVVPVGWKEDKSSGSEPGRAGGWVDLNRLRVQIDPGGEWRQMFSEAWRLQRDYFWFEDMSGVDWEEVRDRYLPLVERVASRDEFSDLMWEMQGELGTSHAYELGGDYRPVPNYRQGLLGADLELRRGRWRIAHLVEGDPWDGKVSSPLAAPGVDAEAGDTLVAIDGVEVNGHVTPQELLVDRGGRPVQLTLKRGRRSGHAVTVTPLVDESRLRYRHWVESNRAAVSEATGGKGGYIHIPDMGPWGFSEFHRSFLTEVTKDGLVIDVRYNRGET